MKHSDKGLQKRFEGLSDEHLQDHLDYFPKGHDIHRACESVMKCRMDTNHNGYVTKKERKDFKDK